MKLEEMLSKERLANASPKDLEMIEKLLVEEKNRRMKQFKPALLMCYMDHGAVAASGRSIIIVQGKERFNVPSSAVLQRDWTNESNQAKENILT